MNYLNHFKCDVLKGPHQAVTVQRTPVLISTLISLKMVVCTSCHQITWCDVIKLANDKHLVHYIYLWTDVNYGINPERLCGLASIYLSVYLSPISIRAHIEMVINSYLLNDVSYCSSLNVYAFCKKDIETLNRLHIFGLKSTRLDQLQADLHFHSFDIITCTQLNTVKGIS